MSARVCERVTGPFREVLSAEFCPACLLGCSDWAQCARIQGSLLTLCFRGALYPYWHALHMHLCAHCSLLPSMFYWLSTFNTQC